MPRARYLRQVASIDVDGLRFARRTYPANHVSNDPGYFLRLSSRCNLREHRSADVRRTRLKRQVALRGTQLTGA